MILSQDGNIFIITQKKPTTTTELAKKMEVLYPKFKNNNVIVNLTALRLIGIEDIIKFLQISNSHRASKQSFVIVSKVAIKEYLNEIIVVPTLQEAYDIIEMEEIERSLGF